MGCGMKIDQTFVPLSEMALKQRCEFLQAELERTIERESRRAVEASSYHDLLMETLAEIKFVSTLGHVHPIARRSLVNLIDKTKRHLREVESGKSWERTEDD